MGSLYPFLFLCTLAINYCSSPYSHCEEHSWLVRSFNPDTRSVFALQEQQYCTAYSEQDEVEGRGPPIEQTARDDGTVIVSMQTNPEPAIRPQTEKLLGTTVAVGKSVAKVPVKRVQTRSFVTCGGNAAPL